MWIDTGDTGIQYSYCSPVTLVPERLKKLCASFPAGSSSDEELMKNKEATYDDDKVPEAKERATPYLSLIHI